VDDRIAFLFRRPLYAQAILDILGDRQPGEGRVLLKHHSPIRPGTRNSLSVNQYFSSIWKIQSGDDPQDGRLAAPGGPHEDSELADVLSFWRKFILDLEIHIVQRVHFFSTRTDEGSRDIAQDDSMLTFHVWVL
jgi:hypothetical protein